MSRDIQLLTGADALKRYHPQLEEIFFEASSVKTFRDQEHRSAFFTRWLGVYLEHYPEQVYLACDGLSGDLLGYLCYHTSSPLPAPYAHPGTETFLDLYDDYPAHLHINCHHRSRGLGVGRFLVERLCENLAERDVPGVHLLTSPDQDNVRFYQKCGFDQVEDREFKGMMLRWMGKKLT